jgi:hypothetical protein
MGLNTHTNRTRVDSMRRFLIAAAIAAALAVPTVASADRPDRDIGTPGTPNCVGQTTAYVTHTLANFFGVDGFAGVAAAFGVTVPELHAIVENYCAV